MLLSLYYFKLKDGYMQQANHVILML